MFYTIQYSHFSHQQTGIQMMMWVRDALYHSPSYVNNDIFSDNREIFIGGCLSAAADD
jgi:hypothetical protein